MGAGQDGSKIFAGTGAPTNIGKAGDWYIDTLNKRLYGPKTNSGWSSSYINLGSSLPPSLPIRKSDYELSSDKKTLVKWKNKRMTHIDMNSNEELKEVKIIANNAFSNFDKIISITLGNKVETIGPYAFYGCENLISVTLPNTLITIEYNAFFRCSSLRNINLPNGLKTIGNLAFSLCEDLESVTIPNSVTYIGSAFSNSGITSIVIPNGITEVDFSECKLLKSVTLPDTITKINFLNCASLTSITIPKGVEEIQRYVFKGCSSLKSIVFHKNIKNIGEESFLGCDSLTSITIPKNVKTIDRSAFYDCKNLKTITFEETTPPTIYYPFDDRYLKEIYVPTESIEIYKNHSVVWRGYAKIIKAKP